jgi:hypothetical protein
MIPSIEAELETVAPDPSSPNGVTWHPRQNFRVETASAAVEDPVPEIPLQRWSLISFTFPFRLPCVIWQS